MRRNQDLLNIPILSFSEADCVHFRLLSQGALIMGSAGSGKTTTSARQLACALHGMLPNCGGLILTAKSSASTSTERDALKKAARPSKRRMRGKR
jgi:hypothetical protein